MVGKPKSVGLSTCRTHRGNQRSGQSTLLDADRAAGEVAAATPVRCNLAASRASLAAAAAAAATALAQGARPSRPLATRHRHSSLRSSRMTVHPPRRQCQRAPWAGLARTSPNGRHSRQHQSRVHAAELGRIRRGMSNSINLSAKLPSIDLRILFLSEPRGDLKQQ